jgi:hypothetical protein
MRITSGYIEASDYVGTSKLVLIIACWRNYCLQRNSANWV